MSYYLWDPSAETDPEVEELEEALSYIRYRPASAELPEPLESAFQEHCAKRPTRFLAAAAALAFMLIASGLWLAWQTAHRREHPVQVVGSSEKPGSRNKIAKGKAITRQPGKEVQELKGVVRLQKTRRDVRRRAPTQKRGEIGDSSEFVRGPSARRPATVKRPEQDLYASNATKGEAAKEQIMLALQISSAKLSLAQRLAQGATARRSKLNP